VVVCNDAEAAALGEAALRGAGPRDVVAYIGIGTGVGGAVVAGSTVLGENLFGHSREEGATRFGDEACRCGGVGCLETVAAGWALPPELCIEVLTAVADAVAVAILADALAATAGRIVIGGGVARRHPALVELVAERLGNRSVEPTAAPPEAKSAAAWGLLRLAGNGQGDQR
jgi:predicted NBD/HSP70 family sugar kinase